jgi:predicted RNase H-like nuclease (RuvC/YqgF family)
MFATLQDPRSVRSSFALLAADTHNREKEITMSEKDQREKELYEQKMRARLDEWKAELDKLKARAKGASADTQIKMNREIEELETAIQEGETRLSALAEASGDAWESIKEGVDAAWESLTSAFDQAKYEQ